MIVSRYLTIHLCSLSYIVLPNDVGALYKVRYCLCQLGFPVSVWILLSRSPGRGDAARATLAKSGLEMVPAD